MIQMHDLQEASCQLTFNSRLRTTFGKLDERDIYAIGGSYERLADLLIRRYEWDHEVARLKVAEFSSSLESNASSLTKENSHD